MKFSRTAMDGVKTARLLFPIMLIVSFSACKSASVPAPKENIIELPALHMKLTLPLDMLLITRDDVQGREALEAGGIDIAACQAEFAQAGIYLNAMPGDFLSEYIISSYKTEDSVRIGDFANYSDEELAGIVSAEALAEDFRTAGLESSAEPVYKAGGKVYFVLGFKRPRQGGYIYSRQFFTISGGIAVNIIYNRFDAPLDSGDLENQQGFIEGIEFAGP
jgi:hypothetical protein